MIEYRPEMHTFRFLFSNGMTEDVRAVQDDSNMRSWVLAAMTGRIDVTDKDLRIVGIAYLDDEQ